MTLQQCSQSARVQSNSVVQEGGGVVDQDVQALPALEGAREHVADLFLVGDIGGNADGFTAFGVDLGRNGGGA